MQDLKLIEQEITDLKTKLNQWNYEYYVLNQPSVSDAVYDKCMNRLILLETTHPQFKTPDSPSVKIGGYVYDKFTKVRHLSPMMSLSNAFTEQDLNKFNQDIITLHHDVNYVVEPKIDGLSIALIYEQGQLKRAVTRGDGVFGEDVTNNVKTISSIPLYLPPEYQHLTIDIRGEVYMAKENFLALNKNLEDNQKPFANPRNAAAGSLRNLDSSITKKRHLDAFFYHVPNCEQLGLKTQYECIEWLKKLGFPTAPNIYLVNSIDEIHNKISEFTTLRDNLPFVIDGIVIKLNQISYYDEIGYTSKFPKWAIAYKFPAEIGLTQINNIEADVGRTGKITYVANLKPIKLDGSLISRVTLNNAEYIAHKDIRVNDWVYLYKAGDVIPYLDYVDVLKRSSNSVSFQPIIKCPSCQSELVKLPNEVEQYCLNHTQCEAQIIKGINYFCERDCMNIHGVSTSIITKLYKIGLLKNIASLYTLHLHQDEILQADLLIKEKSLAKILNAIELSKQNSLEKLLCALGIKNLGATTAKKLAIKFKTLFNLQHANFNELISINDVGEVLAQNIIDYFANSNNQIIINELINNGVNTSYFQDLSGFENIKIIDEYLNKHFVITGTFSIGRNQIKSILENVYHAKISNTITSKVDYLLCGNDAGSKLIKAQELGIKIIRNEFWHQEE